jgi:hypothetical protein
MIPVECWLDGLSDNSAKSEDFEVDLLSQFAAC